MTSPSRPACVLLVAVLLAAGAVRASAHSGPPFPIVSDRIAGPYQLSVWTDPDVTDDRSPAGQFWIIIRLADGSALPRDTRAIVTARSADRPSPAQTAEASPVNGDVGHQFGAVLMDHEGPYQVHVAIRGARGDAAVDSTVDATYDLRPARWLLGLYLLPFAAVGFLWLKLFMARRRTSLPATQTPRRP